MRVEQNLNYVSAASVHQTKKQTGMEQSTFAGKVKEKEEMSLEEYKDYFKEQMDALYTHPSQKNINPIINITDDAYKRMQTDPEYEQKILQSLAKNKAVDFGNYIPVVSYTHIDDTWEGCYGYTKGMKENDGAAKGASSGRAKAEKRRRAEKEKKEQLLEYIQAQLEESKHLQKHLTEVSFKNKAQNAELHKRAFAEKAYDMQVVEAASGADNIEINEM